MRLSEASFTPHNYLRHARVVNEQICAGDQTDAHLRKVREGKRDHLTAISNKGLPQTRARSLAMSAKDTCEHDAVGQHTEKYV